jgi:hypothetical protein
MLVVIRLGRALMFDANELRLPPGAHLLNLYGLWNPKSRKTGETWGTPRLRGTRPGVGCAWADEGVRRSTNFISRNFQFLLRIE